MTQYNVTGMSCAACSARVEKAVSAVPGVKSCAVSLLTNSMGVDGTASPDEIIAAVRAAGYGASLKEKAAAKTGTMDSETAKIVKRLVVSAVFLVTLMYISMGRMAGLPQPRMFAEDPLALALTEMFLSLAVMLINGKFFVNGVKGVLHGAPNMDTLVSLGSGASFIYSAALTVKIASETDADAAAKLAHGLYFESAAMILVLITVGKLLESISKGRTTSALEALISLAPKTATLIRDGNEITVPIDEVRVGDIFVCRPGQSIPVDGTVISGSSAIDESALTGESVPADKTEGDTVYSATVNRSGFLKCRADAVGEDTALSQIIKTVNEASATKAPIARLADRVSGIFVPAVIGIALITFLIWIASGSGVGHSLSRAISVLVISCPCALGLATPVAIMVGSGVGARNGILFKTSAALEAAGKINTVVLDKTGTVTAGMPTVSDVIPSRNATEEHLLSLASSVENGSEHPLAKAIMKYAAEKGVSPSDVTDFEALSGSGVTAKLGESAITGGSRGFTETVCEIDGETLRTAEKLADGGKTPLFFTENGKDAGMIAVSDGLKPDAKAAVERLKNMGLRVVMLTGDNERTARAAAREAGIDEVIAGVMPDGKEKVIKELKTNGKVAMVGDGINDAPALTSADVGIAIGAGADIAVDSADCVLMTGRVDDVPALIKLSRATLTNIKENLFWAFIYNGVCIPLAAGAFTKWLGWEMDPMIAAAAMSLSSFSVVMNALRLNLTDIRENKKTEKAKEIKDMEITMKIEGMMCMHCEAHVKKALEAIDGVAEATPSHESGTAVVRMTREVPFEKLKAAVENEGYKVL